jgi:hypothetical protein
MDDLRGVDFTGALSICIIRFGYRQEELERKRNDPMSGDDEPQLTPASMLDAFRTHPEWSDRDRDFQLGRIVERFSPTQVVEAVQERLADLGGEDADALLRLVELNKSQTLARALGRALLAQPDLPIERTWEALSVLEASGVIGEFLELAERWEDMSADLDEEGSLGQLIEQLDGDPEGVWLALQGLGAVEPETRVQIISSLASESPGPGVVELIRLLAYCREPRTREAALRVLWDESISPEAVWGARVDLRDNHPDPEASAAFRRLLGSGPEESSGLVRSRPRIVRSLVTAVDGLGRGSVVLSAVKGSRRVTAAFLCQVHKGLTEVVGDVALAADSDYSFGEYQRGFEGDMVENVHPLAQGVLAASVWLSGPKTPPVLQYWLEATLGPAFHAEPFPTMLPGFDPASISFDEMESRATDVLDACADWLDSSPLTYELAEELLLRDDDAAPDPKRNPGVYRYLFERRIRGQLEEYRRMLLWMTSFWNSSGNTELARSALVIAWQLSDAQYVVPGHPFTAGLATRSLIAAQNRLRQGLDPRR